MFRNIMLASFAVVLFAFPQASQADATKPAIYAVTFHADWCGSCKVLGPQVEKARGMHNLDSTNVLFVKMDLTDKVTRHQSELLAESLGLGAIYTANNNKTGYVALVNPQTGAEITRITKELKADEIAAKITEVTAQ